MNKTTLDSFLKCNIDVLSLSKNDIEELIKEFYKKKVNIEELQTEQISALLELLNNSTKEMKFIHVSGFFKSDFCPQNTEKWKKTYSYLKNEIFADTIKQIKGSPSTKENVDMEDELLTLLLECNTKEEENRKEELLELLFS